jgi:hypothetical protein
MLLYITAEDVFGDGAPERQGPRPLHRIPDTLAGLFDLGLRHHIRAAAMMWPTTDGFESVPDWRLDRLAIRVALYGREKMGVEPGERVAIFGRLGWLWPVVDFAAMGFGAVPLGIEHDLPDAALAGALAEARPRIVFASDPASAERLQALRREGGLDGDATVVAEGLAAEERALPLERLLELGGVFDTAERAQSFRAVSRQVEPRGEALRHVSPEGVARLTHGEAMERVGPCLRTRVALTGDVAYVGGPRVSLGTRLALATFVGDGLTTTALGQEGRADEDLASLRPHKMIISGEWLEAACRRQGPRWPVGLDRPWARRRLLEHLGGRLRWVETLSKASEQTARALDAAGVTLEVDRSGTGATGPETHTVH